MIPIQRATKTSTILLSVTSCHQMLVARGFSSRLRPFARRTCFRTIKPAAVYSGGFRLFGSKPGSGILGELYFQNDQNDLENIDQSRIKQLVQEIQTYIGYETYDVSLLLVPDEDMRQINLESRGIDEPTDILSFPMHNPIKPGELEPPDFDIPDYYNLGDMIIDVAYVMRRCREDEADTDQVIDRGVSGAMATVYDPEQRLHMLLVHGMLHLVGYDHETDEDCEEMVAKEEEVLKALQLID